MEEQTLLIINDFMDLSNFNRNECNLIEKAFRFSSDAHIKQKRASGEAFITHPLNVAKIISDMGFDAQVIAGALLHDTVEDTNITLQDLEKEFGSEITGLVDGVTKISKIKSENVKQRQAENIRKMLLSMVKDIRVILIKLADKLHNMRTLEYLPKKKAESIARETLDIYAPLSGRLGMSRIKVELEDLALKYLEPEFYYDFKKFIMQKKEKREEYIKNIKNLLQVEFIKYGINAIIYGRAKHFYSIYKKMKAKEKNFEEIFDLFAIRIITKSIKECYEILGIVHKIWKPVRGRFKDYIAMPKSNMYQSLHTTVIGPDGKSLEVQIRTEEMNIIAEEGIAAHWAYKEGKKKITDIEKDLTWLKKLKNWKENMDNPIGFMEDIKKDLLEDEIYVFTPKGEVIELPYGSTPIDFAYKIHTEIGNHCIGAKVNSRIMPLRKSLHSCEVVEILTSKNATPSIEWLDVVKTSRAKHKIRVAVGTREVKKEEKPKEHYPIKNKVEAIRVKKRYAPYEVNLIADGEENVQIKLAKCCNPHPGDKITGYITRGKGITVHMPDCKNLMAIKDYNKRKIRVDWEEKSRRVFNVDIISKDRSGFLLDISSAIANSNANILELNLKTNHDGFVKAKFRLQTQGEKQFKIFLKDVKSLPDVISINYN